MATARPKPEQYRATGDVYYSREIGMIRAHQVATLDANDPRTKALVKASKLAKVTPPKEAASER